MAQKVLVQLVDDLDGESTEEIETVSFAVDGVQYEIDLGPGNAEDLRAALGEFVSSARRVGGRVKRGAAAKATSGGAAPVNREQTKAVREWARQQGHDLSDRGRIPVHIQQAFDEAHASATPRPAKRRSAGRRAAAFSG